MEIWQVESCKMEVGLILFKEIGSGISLNNLRKRLCTRRSPFQEGKIKKTIFPS